MRSLSLIVSPFIAFIAFTTMARFGSLKFVSAGIALAAGALGLLYRRRRSAPR